LHKALQSFLEAVTGEQIPQCLFKLHYEQGRGSVASRADGSIFTFPNVAPSLAFDDATLDPIKVAWEIAMGEEATTLEYLVFPDREAVFDDEMSD